MAHLPLSTESVGFAPASGINNSDKSHAKRGAGRPKGSLNKFTTDVKDMLLAALNAEGGEDYFRWQAKANPTAFMALIGKILPTTLVGDPKRPIVVSVTEEERRREVDAAIDAVFGVSLEQKVLEHEPVLPNLEHKRLEAPCAHCGRSSGEDHAEWCDKPSPGWRSTAEDEHEAEASSANSEPRDGANAEPDDKIVRLPHALPMPE